LDGGVFEGATGRRERLCLSFLLNDVFGCFLGFFTIPLVELDNGRENNQVGFFLKGRLVIAPAVKRVSDGNDVSLSCLKIENSNRLKEVREINLVDTMNIGMDGATNSGGNVDKFF